MNKQVFLFSGLWDYTKIDKKKSVAELNVIHNASLRRELSQLLEVDDLRGINVTIDGRPRALFPNVTVREPTLVSTSLRGLIGLQYTVRDIDLVYLMSGEFRPEELATGFSGESIFLLSTSYVTNFQDLDEAIRRIRRIGPGCLIAGGYLATRNPERTLDCGVDVVCAGDAEEALPRLLQTISLKETWVSIPNLVFKDRDSYVKGPVEMVDLDAIPLAVPAGDLKGCAIPYESMRGCPYQCAFCSYPLVSPTWRRKSARKVFSDFLAIQERGAKTIIALDSTFTIPRSRLHEFLDLCIAHNMRIPWGAYSRTPELKDELVVEKLVKANCKWLSIGFETGSDYMLLQMNKKTRLMDSQRALANLRRHKLAPWSNFIVGFPGETQATVRETIEFISLNIFGFYGLYVFNIRDRYMPALENALFNVEYSEIDGDWTHCTMDSVTAVETRDKAYAEIAVSSREAINIDVFRGTGVEANYSPWDPEFPILKDIELLAALLILPQHFALDVAKETRSVAQRIRLFKSNDSVALYA